MWAGVIREFPSRVREKLGPWEAQCVVRGRARLVVLPISRPGRPPFGAVGVGDSEWPARRIIQRFLGVDGRERFDIGPHHGRKHDR